MANAKGLSLHIGVNRVDAGHYDGWTGPLDACEADAEAMLDIATARGFETRILRTADATRGAVTAAIRGAAAQLQAGDLFMLTYAGHGGQVADISGDEDDDIDETWCLYDGQLIDDELGALWPLFAAGVRVLVLSDSCHSGTVTRQIRGANDLDGVRAKDVRLGMDAARLNYRFMPADVAAPVYRANKALYDAAQRQAATAAGAVIVATVRLLSGCQDDQLSRELDGQGVFTRAVMDVWDGGRFRGDYGAFYRAILSRMPSVQTPNHRVDGAANAAYDGQTPFTI